MLARSGWIGRTDGRTDADGRGRTRTDGGKVEWRLLYTYSVYRLKRERDARARTGDHGGAVQSSARQEVGLRVFI